jgi:tetratricopeptide (TPR) repeat protein
MGYALKARLYGLRGESRATARAGVRAREHFTEALKLDPQLLDAKTGLGLYNYYVDTLSAMARVLRFFMGIPGGSKREGIKQLEEAMLGAELSAAEARFYLAKNLRNYDRDYARSVGLMQPLLQQHPANPLFHLIHGDMLAKLARNDQAAAAYRRAIELAPGNSACALRIRRLASAALAALPKPKAGCR